MDDHIYLCSIHSYIQLYNLCPGGCGCEVAAPDCRNMVGTLFIRKYMLAVTEQQSAVRNILTHTPDYVTACKFGLTSPERKTENIQCCTANKPRPEARAVHIRKLGGHTTQSGAQFTGYVTLVFVILFAPLLSAGRDPSCQYTLH